MVDLRGRCDSRFFPHNGSDTLTIENSSSRHRPHTGCRCWQLDPLFCIRIELLWAKTSLGQNIFVNHAILHDYQKIFARIFDELEILQRITIDQ